MKRDFAESEHAGNERDVVRRQRRILHDLAHGLLRRSPDHVETVEVCWVLQNVLRRPDVHRVVQMERPSDER
jgi:hypothetical protein